MTGLDIKNHWSADGGAFWWNNNISWALQIAALKMKRDKNYIAWEEIRLALENKSFLRIGLYLLDKYDPNKGSKAFSYFSVITKNWLIHKVKRQQKRNLREIDYEYISKNLFLIMHHLKLIVTHIHMRALK